MNKKNNRSSKRRELITFGENVKSLRKKKEWSQEELAAKADLHRTYIGMIERGEKNITLANILKISEALRVAPKKLMEPFGGGKRT